MKHVMWQIVNSGSEINVKQTSLIQYKYIYVEEKTFENEFSDDVHTPNFKHFLTLRDQFLVYFIHISKKSSKNALHYTSPDKSLRYVPINNSPSQCFENCPPLSW